MKKIISILSLVVIAILIGISFIVDVKQNQYINIESDNLMWNLYDINIQEIEQNMDSIMDANNELKWASLRDIKAKDKEYEKILKDLAIKTVNFYYVFENDGTNYSDNNLPIKYRNDERISKQELNDLRDFIKYSCAEKFKYYKDINLNIDEENKERLLNKIDEVLEFEDKYLIKNPKNYNDFIYNEIIETEILKNMSNFLNNEYYRLK